MRQPDAKKDPAIPSSLDALIEPVADLVLGSAGISACPSGVTLKFSVQPRLSRRRQQASAACPPATKNVIPRSLKRATMRLGGNGSPVLAHFPDSFPFYNATSRHLSYSLLPAARLDNPGSAIHGTAHRLVWKYAD